MNRRFLNRQAWLAASMLAMSLACAESDPAGLGPDDPNAKGNDRVPPEAIADPRLTYPVVGGSAFLTWTAPRDDRDNDTVHRYEIRYAYSAPLDWESSLRALDPPEPLAAGQEQTHEFTAPLRGRDLYATIRSYDENGNESPASDVAHVHIDGFRLDGHCMDAMTRQPLADLEVDVTERRVRQAQTDDHGTYELGDVASGVTYISIRSSALTYHGYKLAVNLSDDASFEHLMIEYHPAENPAIDNILSLLMLGAMTAVDSPHLRKWRSYPIPVYIPPLVNGHGIDYEDQCKRALQHWNDRTGLDLFVLVGSPPQDGMTMTFKTRSEMGGIQNGLTRWEEDVDGFPSKAYVDIIDEFADPDRLWKVALHELGHTIRLRHLPSGYLMFQSHPLPDSPTDDEVLMVQLYLALPNDYDVSVHDISDPR